MKFIFQFLLVLFSALFFSDVTSACVHLTGSYDYEAHKRTGAVVDNNQLICTCNQKIRSVNDPLWCECLDGFHAFYDFTITEFAYDTPWAANLRWGITPNWVTRWKVEWDTWAWC
jgi:hypothetical protein